MEGARPIGNIEKERDFDPAKEKTTKGDDRAKGGLNEGNPNIDRTPATKVEEASKELQDKK